MRKALDWDQIKSRLKETERAIENALNASPERTATVFRERALRLARQSAQTDDAAGALNVLEFSLAKENYALEINEIREILPLGNHTPVPSAPPALFGVFNLRGEIVPIVDLARVLELSAPVSAHGYILIVRHQNREVGLKVDQVNQIKKLLPQEIAPAPDISGAQHRKRFKGLAQGSALILDFEALFAHSVFAAD